MEQKKITQGDWEVRFDYEVVAPPDKLYPYPKTVAITYHCQCVKGVDAEDAKANARAISCVPNYQKLSELVENFINGNLFQISKKEEEELVEIMSVINKIKAKL